MPTHVCARPHTQARTHTHPHTHTHTHPHIHPHTHPPTHTQQTLEDEGSTIVPKVYSHLSEEAASHPSSTARSTSNLAILIICKAAPCGIVREVRGRHKHSLNRPLSFVSCIRILQAMCRSFGTDSAPGSNS